MPVLLVQALEPCSCAGVALQQSLLHRRRVLSQLWVAGTHPTAPSVGQCASPDTCLATARTLTFLTHKQLSGEDSMIDGPSKRVVRPLRRMTCTCSVTSFGQGHVTLPRACSSLSLCFRLARNLRWASIDALRLLSNAWAVTLVAAPATFPSGFRCTAPAPGSSAIAGSWGALLLLLVGSCKPSAGFAHWIL